MVRHGYYAEAGYRQLWFGPAVFSLGLADGWLSIGCHGLWWKRDSEPPLFSERHGFVKPFAHVLGWRFARFVPEHFGAER